RTTALRNFAAKDRPASTGAQREFSQPLLPTVLEKGQSWDGRGGPNCWLDRSERLADGIPRLHHNPTCTQPSDPATPGTRLRRHRRPMPRAALMWLAPANRDGERLRIARSLRVGSPG